MNTELSEAGPETMPAQASSALDDGLLRILDTVANRPEIDVSRIAQLVEMRKQELARIAKQQFFEAMSAAQSQMGTIAANAYNKHTRSDYAKLEAVDKAIRPVYTRHGFAINFSEQPQTREGWITVIAVVTHAAGHSESYCTAFPFDLEGINGQVNKTGIHAVASAKTYARRYCLMDVFNLSVGQDDDGNAAGGGTITSEQAEEIKRRLSAAGADTAKFCAWIKAPSIEQIPPRDLARAMHAVGVKEKAKAEKAKSGG